MPRLRADAWSYKLLSREEFRALSAAELAQFSPSEKYNILVGDYSYLLTNSERSSKIATDEKWWGICHGWAPAAYNYEEPRAVTVRNRDGIDIPFGSSDVKALLSFQQGRSGRSVLLGQRCNVDLAKNPGSAGDLACRDVNAGSFHIVLANQIRLIKKPFVMDVTRDLDVWNQPIYSFQTRKLSERAPSRGAAAGTVVEYEIISEVTYIVEMTAAWNTRVGSENAKKRARYHYFVEVNAAGEIIGGSWVSEDRPDFLWTIDGADLTGFFAPLRSLYEQSVAGASPIPTPVPTATPSPGVTPVPTVAPAPTVAHMATPVPTAIANPTPVAPPYRGHHPDRDPCRAG